MASIVAGNHVGLAPGAKLVALRVFSYQFNLTPNILMKAFDAIIAHAFDIFYFSWGFEPQILWGWSFVNHI